MQDMPKKEILCQVFDPFDVNHPEWLDRRGGVVTQALAVRTLTDTHTEAHIYISAMLLQP